MTEIPAASLLLVDDRPENLLALEAILEPLGCNLLRAYSGTEALKHLLGGDIALILMDVQMPGMDGFDTAAIIKEREKTRHIPIIFITALSTEEVYVFQGYSAGAVDYLAKPYNPHILRSKVAVFVDLWNKSEQIKQQGELLRQVEQREQQALAREREREAEQRHMKQLLQAKNEAERAREVAERANRAKSEFISNVSHELRTPLNAIIGFSKLLLNPRVGPLNDDQESCVNDVVHSGEHLLQIINDILDLSKIEAGKMTLEIVAFSLPDLLEQSLVIVREKALLHNLEISVEIMPEVVEMAPLQADQRKIKQVMFNLLSNAVKFTPDGGRIVVRAVAATAEEDAVVVVSVSDTGIGISPDHQTRIFDAFEQVDSSYARQQQGTGLGLPLTKRIVELHGGRLWLDSAEGQGSTFFFSLPLIMPASSSPPANETNGTASHQATDITEVTS